MLHAHHVPHPVHPPQYESARRITRRSGPYRFGHGSAVVRYTSLARATIIENFASHAAVQKFVDVKPDWARPEVLGHRMRQVLPRLVVLR